MNTGLRSTQGQEDGYLRPRLSAAALARRAWSPRALGRIAVALGFLTGLLLHPRRVVSGLWRRRRAVWPWLDDRLGDARAWRRFNSWRRRRVVRRCARRNHPLHGTLLPNGEPGKMCPACGYVQQITPREFKRLFGMPVSTAIARTRAEGQQVHNAMQWGQTHRITRGGRTGGRAARRA